ncbi:MAG: universal stress protein [Bacteroidetes bacterium]|nr:universal stress protein [Bacteroidota bacterium]
MGNILVLTDFSENSFRAAEWALLLAEKSRARLVIFHSYLGVPVIPYDTYTGQGSEPEPLMRIDEEFKQALSEFAQRLEHKAAENDSNNFTPVIETELGEGNLGINVKELIEKKDIELVVMGSTEKTRFGHLLMGNKIGQVIEKVNTPVLIVPVQSRPARLEKVTFAVNFDNSEIRAFHLLAHLSERFGFSVEVVHIITAGESYNDEAKRALMDKLNNGNRIVNLGYHAVKGTAVLARLKRECKKNGCDLLAMTHRQYSLLQRMFHKSTARAALHDQKLPLLIFPSKAEE